MSNPFGSAPAEDLFDLSVPDAKDDPFRPIGECDPVTGEYLQKDKPAKLEVNGRCTALTNKQGPSGPMAVFSFVVTEGVYAGRDFDLHVSFSPKARFKVVETYKAFDLPLDRPYPKSQAIGVNVILCLRDEEYQERWSAKLNAVKPHPKGAGYRGTNALPA